MDPLGLPTQTAWPWPPVLGAGHTCMPRRHLTLPDVESMTPQFFVPWGHAPGAFWGCEHFAPKGHVP